MPNFNEDPAKSTEKVPEKIARPGDRPAEPRLNNLPKTTSRPKTTTRIQE
ncbi:MULTISPECIES: hypothetical protein [Pseudomonas syringae group]|nr:MULTISPECIES: hypothetical protein [Pseudomonas syringae group]